MNRSMAALLQFDSKKLQRVAVGQEVLSAIEGKVSHMPMAKRRAEV